MIVSGLPGKKSDLSPVLGLARRESPVINRPMPEVTLQVSERPGRRPQGGAVTVMFADMVGYSHRLQSDQERNSAQAAKSIRLFKTLIADYGGKVVNVAG